MKTQKIPLDTALLLNNIKDKTYRAQLRVKRVFEVSEQLMADSEKVGEARAKRLSQLLCVVCFYLESGRMCGQAFTASDCRSCGKELMSSNTHTDDFCADCAKKYRICKDCGSDLELKTRKTL